MIIDTYTLKHLDAWLDTQIGGDIRRAKVRAAMLTFIAGDQEYWSSQSWWRVYDGAKCEMLD